MRRSWVLLVAMTLPLAGCFGGEDDADATPTPTTPTETSPTPTTPTPDDPMDPDTNDSMDHDMNDSMDDEDTDESEDGDPADEPPEPVEVLNVTFDYSSGSAAGPDGTAQTFDVPEGHATVAFTGEATQAGDDAGLPTGGGVSLNAAFTITDPDGSEVASESVQDGSTFDFSADALAGAWTVTFEGTGNLELTLRAVAT